uniref:SEC24 homolog C, COPII coat complex component n=2 Tax=Latimeria chalumnae TaxID=7897 RepID=H3ATB3_LATCH
LNPDAIPSVVKVMEDDKATWGSQVFATDARGQLPPLTSTDFTVEDQGNCSPRFIRCTTYSLPSTPELAQLSHLPLAAIIKPLASLPASEAPPPVVDHGEFGPVRCTGCRAFMCPSMQFIEVGQRFRCPFCMALSDVPWQYYRHTDSTGKRVDQRSLQELCRGSYEFLTNEDPDKLSSAPAFIFMIDVSYNAVRSGLLRLLCEELRTLIHLLPREKGADLSQVKVGFVTYDKALHFYNVSSSLTQPHMLVVTDISDVELPLLDGFLVLVNESRALIESLLDQIPVLFADTQERDAIFGPVVQSGITALKAFECPGKLFVFHTSVPAADRNLKIRTNPGTNSTKREKSLFQPQGGVCQSLVGDCIAQGCSVDLFLFPDTQYMDVATLGSISYLTGGNLHLYSNFKRETDAQQFLMDLRRGVTRDMGFKGEMKIYVNKGLKVAGFWGSSWERCPGQIALAGIDCDKTIAVEFKHDGRLCEEAGVLIQCALLYTSVSGQRRVRVHNLSLTCASQLADTFRNSQAEVLLNFFSKTAYNALLESPAKAVRDGLVTRIIRILACYRRHCAKSLVSAGQLVMPQFLKILPVYLNCLRKSEVLLPGAEISVDERAYLRQLVMSLDVEESGVFFYPHIIPLLDWKAEADPLPTPIRCSGLRLQDTGVYLAEDGLTLILWLGVSTPAEWIQNVFDVPSFDAVASGVFALPVLDNPASNRVREAIRRLRSRRLHFLKVLIVKQGDELEKQFRQFLVEDKSPNGGASYSDFLYHVHVSVQQLLK